MSVKSSVFQPVEEANRVNYPRLEHTIQQWWDENDVLKKYLQRNEQSAKRYSFLDGPMTANNPMGVHHAWGRTYKDLYQRFKTMQGFRQRYQNGFDCQGLWVEVEVEKQLGLKNKQDIETKGIANFVNLCKERVFTFANQIIKQSIRLGQWADWGNDYYTLSDENNYTIWSFLKKCQEKNLIYKGHDVMTWCPRCATGISNMETLTEDYHEIKHLSLYVRLPLLDRPGEYLLVWTTTPWTLAANVAAAVHPEFTYAKVEQDGEFYYLAENLLPALSALKGHDKGDYQVVETLKGEQMVGWKYSGPFDELPAQQGIEHQVIPWKDVSSEEGTGIVHIAPGCGHEDFGLGKEFHLPVIAPVDDYGVYREGFDWLSGLEASQVSNQVAQVLTERHLLYRSKNYLHRYPVCWRCKTELIFRLVDEWFISMDKLRYEIMETVKQITWLPAFGYDREMDWLNNMDDWMISKKRYWGLALPIYECLQCGSFEIIGSREELQARAVSGWEEFDGNSPHRPWVDSVKIACKECGSEVSRIKDVGNPWLDAGIVPYSTMGYRSNPDYWQQWFPADFVTESFPGQFKNWFYSMLVMSTVLENRPPFQTLFGYGTLMGEDGTPMHKSKGNLVIFDEAAERVGSDTMRWLFANHIPEQNLNFPSIPGTKEAQAAEEAGNPLRLNEKWMLVRRTLDKIWNVYKFFVNYANIDGFDPSQVQMPVAERNEINRWILSELQGTIRQVTEGLERYDSAGPATAILEFLEDLSNWYLRRIREDFWRSNTDSAKIAAYLTLYECLTTLTTLIAPFMPFLAEELYQNLVRSVDSNAPFSVHLCDWPLVNEALLDEKLNRETRLIMRVVGLGNAARDKAQIRVRQPLNALYVRATDQEEEGAILRLKGQIMEELNVRQVLLIEADSDMLAYTLKPQVKILGPKYGSLVQKILQKFKSLDAHGSSEAARQLSETGRLSFTLEGQQIELTAEEVQVVSTARPGFTTAEERGYVVILETTITPELHEEGLVRDLTRQIQDMRKKANLKIEDRIALVLSTDQELATILERHRASLQEKLLAPQLSVVVADAVPPEINEIYRERIAPEAAKKLAGFTCEVKLGSLV